MPTNERKSHCKSVSQLDFKTRQELEHISDTPVKEIRKRMLEIVANIEEEQLDVTYMLKKILENQNIKTLAKAKQKLIDGTISEDVLNEMNAHPEILHKKRSIL